MPAQGSMTPQPGVTATRPDSTPLHMLMTSQRLHRAEGHPHVCDACLSLFNRCSTLCVKACRHASCSCCTAVPQDETQAMCISFHPAPLGDKGEQQRGDTACASSQRCGNSSACYKRCRLGTSNGSSAARIEAIPGGSRGRWLGAGVRGHMSTSGWVQVLEDTCQQVVGCRC
jgi:hypothetical protein